MAGSGSSRMVAMKFNRKHGTNITHNTVAKLINKLKKTENVADQLRSGPRRTATDEDTTATTLKALIRSHMFIFPMYGNLRPTLYISNTMTAFAYNHGRSHS